MSNTTPQKKAYNSVQAYYSHSVVICLFVLCYANVMRAETSQNAENAGQIALCNAVIRSKNGVRILPEFPFWKLDRT